MQIFEIPSRKDFSVFIFVHLFICTVPSKLVGGNAIPNTSFAECRITYIIIIGNRNDSAFKMAAEFGNEETHNLVN